MQEHSGSTTSNGNRFASTRFTSTHLGSGARQQPVLVRLMAIQISWIEEWRGLPAHSLPPFVSAFNTRKPCHLSLLRQCGFQPSEVARESASEAQGEISSPQSWPRVTP